MSTTIATFIFGLKFFEYWQNVRHYDGDCANWENPASYRVAVRNFSLSKLRTVMRSKYNMSIHSSMHPLPGDLIGCSGRTMLTLLLTNQVKIQYTVIDIAPWIDELLAEILPGCRGDQIDRTVELYSGLWRAITLGDITEQMITL